MIASVIKVNLTHRSSIVSVVNCVLSRGVVGESLPNRKAVLESLNVSIVRTNLRVPFLLHPPTLGVPTVHLTPSSSVSRSRG